MTLNLDPIIGALVALVPIIPGLALLFKRLVSLEQRLVPPAEMDHIKSIVRSAVSAVEQTCSAMQGPDKKSEAVRLIGTLLNEHGLKVSPTMLDTLIEQGVYLINQGKDPQATSVVPIVKP